MLFSGKIQINYLLSPFFYAIYSFIEDRYFLAFYFFCFIMMYVLNTQLSKKYEN